MFTVVIIMLPIALITAIIEGLSYLPEAMQERRRLSVYRTGHRYV
jgi:hypothetical protein